MSRTLVLAGDTLVIDKVHVQLANAVAPQPIPDAHCWAEALASKYAIQRVKDLVRSARTLQVQPTGQLDNYGRTVANVSLDGLDLGRTLYDEGVAAQPKGGRFRWCAGLSEERDGGPAFGAFGESGR